MIDAPTRRMLARSYAWWGYALAFAGALSALHRLLPPVLWRVVLGLTAAGLAYFTAVESLIAAHARTDADDGRDYLIVLGAGVYGDRPSLTLLRRAEGAADYLRRHPGSTAVVSGGMGPDETVSEARALFDRLTALGVDPGRILLEEAAATTEENLRFSFELLRARGVEPAGRVAILSSAYHLYRAGLMAKKLGAPDPALVAAPWGKPLVMLNYFIREAFAVTHFWAFGR